jgi:hypothetical protein
MSAFDVDGENLGRLSWIKWKRCMVHSVPHERSDMQVFYGFLLRP